MGQESLPSSSLLEMEIFSARLTAEACRLVDSNLGLSVLAFIHGFELLNKMRGTKECDTIVNDMVIV